MLFSRDLLFIHVPKTGGMSMTKYLLDVLPRPVYYAHPCKDEALTDEDIVQIPGVRHDNLQEASDLVQRYGFHLSDFPLILAVARNPYAMEVSRYTYLRAGHNPDRGSNERLARNTSFETFAVESTYQAGSSRPLARPLEGYYTIDGKAPKNMQILKFENLANELDEALRKIGIDVGSLQLPWLNRSDHGDVLSYYTRRAEEAVYRKSQWVFDNGFYERMSPEVRRAAFSRRQRAQRRYRQLVERIRDRVRTVVPADATVIAVTTGDGQLLQLDGRRAWHFPQMEDGTYAGPSADSAAAITHLEALRARGADFLLIPSVALWWLDYYGELKEHLEARYRAVLREIDTCVLFALRQPKGLVPADD